MKRSLIIVCVVVLLLCFTTMTKAAGPAKASVTLAQANGNPTSPEAGNPSAITADASRWENRNTPQSLKNLTHEFIGFLNITEAELAASNLQRRPEYAAVAKLARDNKESEALDAFVMYFSQKLRRPIQYGLSPTDFDPYVRGISHIGDWPSYALDPRGTQPQDIEAANRLLNNHIFHEGKEAEIGEPGKVNWNFPYPAQGLIPAGKAPLPGLISGGIFTPLVQAFLATHDRKYLDKWYAFMDDWSLRCIYADTIHPLMVPDNFGGMGTDSLIVFIRMLSAIAAALPQNEPVMPSRIFAQHIRRRVFQGLPLCVSYIKSNTHNWTPSANLAMAAMMLDELKVAPFYFREGLRRNVEDNAATQNLRDGAENQQCPWYNNNYMNVAAMPRLIDTRMVLPIWLDVPWIAHLQRSHVWRQEIREHLFEHATYLIHIRTPQGEWPIPFRGGDKRGAALPPMVSAPDAFEDPVNMQILAAVNNPDAGVRPNYTSEWFPYAGYNIVREGWEKNSGYGAMFCSPVPGAYGGYRSRSNNNTLGIAAFGQDLIIDDTTGHYMYPSSPIKVDGMDQFFHAGIYKVPMPAGHKVYQVSAWTEPANWRWHASDRLNLMEGVYAGAWSNGKRTSVVVGPYGQDDSMLPGLPRDQATYGITHQRLAMYLRIPKIWIVTDRLLAAGSHEYTQNWLLPTLKSPSAGAFTPEQIKISATQRLITTVEAETPTTNPAASSAVKSKPSKVHVSLHQFGPAAIHYESKDTQRPARDDGRILMYGYDKIACSWKGTGNQQMITAIVPRAPGSGPQADLTDTTQIRSGKSGIGFQATGPAGTRVQYLTSTEPNDELILGDVKAKTQSLLLAGGVGMALDCSELSINGKAVAITQPDFEFGIADGKITTIEPIYRPISPVQISPNQNIFTDHLDVTLTSTTPAVEIHYTTDGSDPTPQSKLYTGAFTLGNSAMVKARAYRPGVRENPPELDGTFATVASTAVFDKTNFTEAVPPTKSIKPGLTCRYWQDDWRRLWTQLDDLKPQASGEVGALWDYSLVPSDNSALGSNPSPRSKYYALEYSGFLNVPEDGVYVLHAPRECVWPDVDPGYLLDVYLGNRNTRAPGFIGAPGLNEWYPATRLHAMGTWSIALKKGLHPLRIVFVDYRTNAPKLLNMKGVNDYIWSGFEPDLEISGPGIAKQAIPKTWFKH